MDCRSFRAEIRRHPTGPVDEQAERHRATCPRCMLERRAAVLLRLGSGPRDGTPRAGFEQRVRGRIPREGTAAGAAPWPDAIGVLSRPALALAVSAVVLSVLVAWWDGRAGSGGGREDLALLAETDAAFASFLSGDAGDLLALPKGPDAQTEPAQ